YDGQLQFYPEDPGGTMIAGQYHRVVLTRSSDNDEVVGYLDGAEVLRFTDSEFWGKVENAGNLLNFFVDDEQTGEREVSAGRVALLRVYQETLTPAEVAALNGTLHISVHNVPPTVTSPGNQSGFRAGEAAMINLGSFADPGTDSPYQVRVNWGDGACESFTV